MLTVYKNGSNEREPPQPEAPKLQKSIFPLRLLVLKNGFSKFGSDESGTAGLNWFLGCSASNIEALLCTDISQRPGKGQWPAVLSTII